MLYYTNYLKHSVKYCSQKMKVVFYASPKRILVFDPSREGENYEHLRKQNIKTPI